MLDALKTLFTIPSEDDQLRVPSWKILDLFLEISKPPPEHEIVDFKEKGIGSLKWSLSSLFRNLKQNPEASDKLVDMIAKGKNSFMHGTLFRLAIESHERMCSLADKESCGIGKPIQI